jgi:hypothetical protein
MILEFLWIYVRIMILRFAFVLTFLEYDSSIINFYVFNRLIIVYES